MALEFGASDMCMCSNSAHTLNGVAHHSNSAMSETGMRSNSAQITMQHSNSALISM